MSAATTSTPKPDLSCAEVLALVRGSGRWASRDVAAYLRASPELAARKELHGFLSLVRQELSGVSGVPVSRHVVRGGLGLTARSHDDRAKGHQRWTDFWLTYPGIENACDSKWRAKALFDVRGRGLFEPGDRRARRALWNLVHDSRFSEKLQKISEGVRSAAGDAAPARPPPSVAPVKPPSPAEGGAFPGFDPRITKDALKKGVRPNGVALQEWTQATDKFRLSGGDVWG